MTFHSKKWRDTDGYIENGPSVRKVSVAYDADTFKRVKELSDATGMTFAHTVRSLVKKGLDV